MTRLSPNTIIIDILESDRDELFTTTIKTKSGKKQKFVKDLKAAFGTDKSYSQGLGIGVISGIADDMKDIYEIGDRVIFNSMLDSSPEVVFEETETAKRVAVFGAHTYHTESWYTPPNTKSSGGWAWKEGEINNMSHVYAIIRDGEFIAINDMIFCEHQFEKNKHTETGIYYVVHADKEQVITRKVIYAHAKSVIIPGQYAMVDQRLFVTIEIGGIKYDCFNEDDIFIQIVN